MAISHERIPGGGNGAAATVTLRGYVLRSWLLLTLRDHGQVMTVADLVDCLEQCGFRTQARPSKDVSDALRWEVRRGRARRVARSTYELGCLPRQTAWRMRRRLLAQVTDEGAAGATGRGREGSHDPPPT